MLKNGVYNHIIRSDGTCPKSDTKHENRIDDGLYDVFWILMCGWNRSKHGILPSISGG